MNILIAKIQAALTPDLLKGDWGSHPHAGHCYVASEALFHLTGKVMKPCRATDERGISHWWLETNGEIIDVTARQYTDLGLTPPYSRGKGSGFLTREPSKRARTLMERLSQ